MPFYWCDQTKTARVDIKMRLPNRRFPYLPVKKSFQAHDPDNSRDVQSMFRRSGGDRQIARGISSRYPYLNNYVFRFRGSLPHFLLYRVDLRIASFPIIIGIVVRKIFCRGGFIGQSVGGYVYSACRRGRRASKPSRRFFKRDRQQASAIIERITTYARHAFPYGYGRQARAIIERTIPYARHAVRNGYGRDAGLIGKRIRRN